ncbi:hypothetical protein [Phormidesmis priestleyi]
MRMLDLSKQNISLEDLLKLAASESVCIVSETGQTFILEEADEFDQEVETLGKSEKFKKFLSDRSRENSAMSLKSYQRSLDQD